MSLEPNHHNEARTINGLSRSDILRIAQQDKLKRAQTLSASIKAAGTIGKVGEPLPVGVPGSKQNRKVS